jgi:hypothetical protein
MTQAWLRMPETTETCGRCGQPLTGAMIVARWSPETFLVSCPCSPGNWIVMELPKEVAAE